MSRTGDCDDNALAESFFATLKTELVDRHHWAARPEARQATFEWIEVVDHRQRLHSALGYVSPVAFEEWRLPMPIAASSYPVHKRGSAPKAGTKRHLITDRAGTPLACCLTGANAHDSLVFEDLIDAIPPIRQPNGHRRKRPLKLHADQGNDIPRCRQALTRRHITVWIARKGIASRQHLGKHRWVVERTFAWLNHERRLTIRSERRQDIHAAFLSLGCSLICFKTLTRF